MRALLVDESRDRATLVAVRSLAAAASRSAPGRPEPSFASLSRYARRHHLVRECAEDEDGFVADVAAAVRDGGYDIVFCSYETGPDGAVAAQRGDRAGRLALPALPRRCVAPSTSSTCCDAVRAAGLNAPQTEPAG